MATVSSQDEGDDDSDGDADDNLKTPTETVVASESDFRKVTNQLGPDELQHLFHNLGIPQRDIEHVEKSADTTDTRLKARAVLRWWKQTKGRAATLQVLLEATRTICGSTAPQQNMQQSLPGLHLNMPQNLPWLQQNTQQNLPGLQQNMPQNLPWLQQNTQQNLPGLQPNMQQNLAGLQQNMQQAPRGQFLTQQYAPSGPDPLMQPGSTPDLNTQQAGVSGAAAGQYSQLMPPMMPYPYMGQYMIHPLMGQPYGLQVVTPGNPYVPQEIPLDVDICQKRLRDIYKTRRKGITFLPGMPKNFDIEEFFVELKLLSEEIRPAKVRCQELDKYTDLLTLKNGQDREQKHVLVRGVAGTGKTTLISRLAYQWDIQDVEELREGTSECKLKEFKLLFAIDIRKIQPEMDLIDVLIDQLLPDVSRKSLQSFLAGKSDSCIFLCDGYDELKSRKTNIFNNTCLCSAHVIVTTRPQKVDEYITSNEGYAHVSLEGFSLESVYRFIFQFFTSSEKSNMASEKSNMAEAQDQCRSMIQSIMSSPVLTSLTCYPLLLAMMCLIWQQHEKLPETVTSLYEQAVEYLGRHWMVKCQKEQPHQQSSTRDYSQFKESVGVDNVLMKLGETALLGLLQNSLIFNETVFESSDLIHQACCLGLVYKESVVKGFDKVNLVTFIHFTFQEFCAARYLVYLAETDKKRFCDFLDHIIRWDNILAFEIVLKFCCGMNSKAAERIVTHVVNMILMLKKIEGETLRFEYTRHSSILRNSWSLPFRLVFEADLQSGVNATLHSCLHPLTVNLNVFRLFGYTSCSMFSHREMSLIVDHYATMFTDQGMSRNQTWLANVTKVAFPIEFKPFLLWQDFLCASKQFIQIIPNLTELSISCNTKIIDLRSREALYLLSMSVFDDVVKRQMEMRQKPSSNSPCESPSQVSSNLVDIRDCKQICCAFLSIKHQIKRLNIEFLCFDMNLLVAFLTRQIQLEGLRLVGNCISDRDMVKLMSTLESKSPLSLELCQNPVGHHLSTCHVIFSHLHELSLSYAGMDSGACAQLFEAFIAQGKQVCLQDPTAKLPLRKLDMSWNKIGDAVDKLAEAFPYMSDLNQLDLSVTNLEGKHVMLLSSAFKYVQNLQHIVLVGCHFGDAMSKFMQDLQQLEKLVVLKVCGVTAFACEHVDADYGLNLTRYLLAVNSFCAEDISKQSYRFISHEHGELNGIVCPTQIGSDGTKVLCHSLHFFSLLTCLDLSRNAMKSHGVFALCDILNHVPLLETLSLHTNLIEEGGMMKLAQSFHLIPKLQELVLGRGNDRIHASCADVFFRNLVYLQQLNSLNMPGIEVTNEECESMPLLTVLLQIRRTYQQEHDNEVSSKYSILKQEAIRLIISQVEHFLISGTIQMPVSELYRVKVVNGFQMYKLL